MTPPEVLPRIPPPPRAKRDPLTPKQAYYVSVLHHWYRYRKRAPTCLELGNICQPKVGVTAVRTALIAAEAKGYCLRDEYGRFRVMP